eukprot:SAG22_NODE_3262_length_1823_cov_1.777842_3_plen_27_part_01
MGLCTIFRGFHDSAELSQMPVVNAELA